MTALVRLKPGEFWEFKGLELRFDREFSNGILHFIVERTLAHFQVEAEDGSLVAPTWDWLLHHLGSGDLRRIDRNATRNRIREIAEGREHDTQTIREMDPKAALRAFVLRGFDKRGVLPRSDKQIRQALRELWLDQSEASEAFRERPAPRTVRRWLTERGEPGERALRQMVSMSGRVPRRRRLAEIMIAMMQRVATWYWAFPGASKRDAYARFTRMFCIVRASQWASLSPTARIPSRTTLEKQIDKLECFDTYRIKHGEKRAKQRFKATGVGLKADRFLRLGCMDHTILDAVLVIDSEWLLPLGRPTLTIVIDVATRCVVGFLISFEPPSIYSVAECIRRANRPKHGCSRLHAKYPHLAYIFGRFDELVVDNGKEFAGTSLEDAMADIGTSIRYAPVASPTYKAAAERFFRTLNQRFIHKLPGASLPPALMREMGYDPKKDAVLSLEQLERLIWEAVSHYHIDLHSGINAVPAQLWKRDLEAHGVDFFSDERALDKMLGKMKPSARVTTSGVDLFGLQFHDPAKVEALIEDLISLQPKRGQRKGSASVLAKVKYNPANISEIHVWNARRNKYVTLPCLDATYTSGISLWHHQKTQEWAKNKGLEFSTEEDRLKARSALTGAILKAAPGLRGKVARDMRRLLNNPKIGASGDATIAYAPARHDGLAPVIPHDTLAAERTDGGQVGARPAPKARRPTFNRPRKSPVETAIALPEAGYEDDVVIDLTAWKELTL